MVEGAGTVIFEKRGCEFREGFVVIDGGGVVSGAKKVCAVEDGGSERRGGDVLRGCGRGGRAGGDGHG